MVLAMVPMDLESVMLMLSQRLMPMLSMAHMESMVLDTVLILWDMVMAILATAMDMVLAMALMDMESAMLSQRLMLNLSLMLRLSMVLMEDTVWAMVPMDMESVMLRLSQRLMPMLSMDHMESTVLDTALILWDMVMAILATAMDMVLAMAVMGMESAMP